MITRRRFLMFVTTLVAINNTAKASTMVNKTSFTLNESRELCLYKGWILRADDLEPGE